VSANLKDNPAASKKPSALAGRGIMATQEEDQINKRVAELKKQYERYQITLTTSQGTDVILGVRGIVRAYPPIS